MISRISFLLLAASSTLAGFAQTEDIRWPHNLQKGQRYWPEHESLVRLEESARARLATETPIGMKKMSNDPTEMFFMHYWHFEEDITDDHMERSDRSLRQEDILHSSNASALHSFTPPIPLHTDEQSPWFLSAHLISRNIFDKRNYQCPSGTYACTSINRPNSCCSTTETCQIVSNSGSNGDVGCCPQGQTCGGQVAACNTAAGYTGCPNSSNGGCCIPGYACQDVGCVASFSTTTTRLSVVTVTVTSGQSVVTSTQTPRITPVTTVVTVQQTQVVTYTTAISSTTPSVVTHFTTIAPSQTTVTVVASGFATVLGSGNTTCASGFQSCPASVGGGCCPSDHACPSSGTICPPMSTATVTQSTTVSGPAAPVRPTSGDNQMSTVTTTLGAVSCPANYYACSAHYIGGCCQTGLNCDLTSCPTPVVETINSSGATIVAPFTVQSGTTVTAQATTTSGSTTTGSASGNAVSGQCASGWFQCSSDASDGCCPGGYTCGASLCVATAGSQPSTVHRIPVHNTAVSNGYQSGSLLVIFATIVGFLMVLL